MLKFSLTLKILVRRTLQRAILLQTEATKRKTGILRNFSRKAMKCANWMLDQKTDDQLNHLWARVGRHAKESTGFNSQIVCDLARNVSKAKGDHIGAITVKFNVPRNCKTFETKEFFFVELGMYPGNRLAIPIRRNRNFERFQSLLRADWTCKTLGLTPSLEICAYLSKEKSMAPRRNVLGIDINNEHFAYTVLTPEGEILKQGYLGKHIWPMKHHFERRRALLQSLSALKKLKLMRHKQRDFVYTNLGQMSAEIVKLAKEYDADIVIENLSRFKPKGRIFNKKAMTIPFAKFRRILEARCFDNGIMLSRVESYHTSRWCSHCGAVGKGHDGSNYALFRCRACGQVVNSDRKASLAVAVKSLLERNRSPNQEAFQISGRRVPVSGLVRVPDAARPMAVPVQVRSRGKPTGFSRG